MSESSFNNDFINKLVDPPKRVVKAPLKPIKTPSRRFDSKTKRLAIGYAALFTISSMAVGLISSKIYGGQIDVEQTANQVIESENQIGYLESMLEGEFEQGITRTYEEEVNVPTKHVCIDIPQDATVYLSEVNYNKVINNFGSEINNYSQIYGVDPNVIAGIIMVENPDYDINDDRHYHQIGLGQFDGQFFDNETFKSYNFENHDMDYYTVHVENLYQNPDEQIKLLCMTVANSAKRYDYNVTAILENHNKGCGSVDKCLELLKNENGYNSRKEVLEYEDQNEIIKNINKIGDPNYSYKVSYYIDMGINKKTFNDNGYIKFTDPETFEEVTIEFQTRTNQRS